MTNVVGVWENHTERTQKGRNVYIILIGNCKHIYRYIISENTRSWDDSICALHRLLISHMSPASLTAPSEYIFVKFNPLNTELNPICQ